MLAYDLIWYFVWVNTTACKPMENKWWVDSMIVTKFQMHIIECEIYIRMEIKQLKPLWSWSNYEYEHFGVV